MRPLRERFAVQQVDRDRDVGPRFDDGIDGNGCQRHGVDEALLTSHPWRIQTWNGERRHHARRARQVRDEPDLADDVARTQPSHRGDTRRRDRRHERRGDAAAQHEHTIARVALATDQLAGGKVS
jgi:hypothetical protein